MSTERLTGARLGGVLLLPWLFLTVFSLMFINFLWPKIADGHGLAIVIGVFVATIFAAGCAAAVTFTRDVISGRYPGRA